MLVTDRQETGGRDLVDVVEAAVGGGVGLVQVRERDLTDAEVEALLGRILDRLRGTEARVVVNGRPAIARALGIGLHLPAAHPTGLPPPRAAVAAPFTTRARRGGRSPRTPRTSSSAPMFPTGSKPGHPGAGLDTLARLVRIVAPVPVFAIGGLTPERVGARAGGRGPRRRRAERDPRRPGSRAGRPRVRGGPGRGLRGSRPRPLRVRGALRGHVISWFAGGRCGLAAGLPEAG